MAAPTAGARAASRTPRAGRARGRAPGGGEVMRIAMTALARVVIVAVIAVTWRLSIPVREHRYRHRDRRGCDDRSYPDLLHEERVSQAAARRSITNVPYQEQPDDHRAALHNPRHSIDLGENR